MNTPRLVKVGIAAFKGFLADGCSYKASALTFNTLLSIVPLLAIAFGVAQSLGFETYLEKELSSVFLDQPQLSNQLISFARSVLKTAHGGVIAIIGLFGLLWVSFQLFSNIELSLNEIWKVKTQRSPLKQIKDYLVMVFIGPFFFVISSALSLYTTTAISQVVLTGTLGEITTHVLSYGLTLFPFLIVWILFACIYAFLPNVLVPWKNAIIAAVIAGSFYQILQTIYIYFQIGVAGYGAIYGSFAALPLFLVWLNTSWNVVLFGAEIAYRMDTIPKGTKEEKIYLATKKELAFVILSFFAEAFSKKETPLNNRAIAEKLQIPVNTVRLLTTQLCDAKWIKSHPQGGFFLIQPPDEITIKNLLASLEDPEKFPIYPSKTFENFKSFLTTYETAASESPTNLSLKEITG